MGKKNFIEQLRDYQKRVNYWIHRIKGTHYNDERNTMVKFVIPLFEMLGWNPLSKDMEFEYTVRGKEMERPGHVDIALYTKNPKKPKIFVEVKCLQDKLDPGRQLLSYLHAEKIDYGVYTNGRELKLIDRHTPSKYTPEGLFIMKIGDFVKYKRILFVLSKKSVEEGKLDKLANSYHNEEYWDWRDEYEKKHPGISKYYLPLIYANERL